MRKNATQFFLVRVVARTMDADAYLSWRPRLEYRLPKLAKLWRASLLGDIGASEALAELNRFEAEFVPTGGIRVSEHAPPHAREPTLPSCVDEVLTLGRAHLRELASAWKGYLVLLHGSVSTMLGTWLDRYGGDEDASKLKTDVEECIGALRSHHTPDSARSPALVNAVDAMKAWATSETHERRTRLPPAVARGRAATYHARVRRMEAAIAQAFARDLREVFASSESTTFPRAPSRTVDGVISIPRDAL